MAEKLQMVMNTIEGLEIKATFDNMGHLLACLQVLRECISELRAQETKEAKESEG